MNFSREVYRGEEERCGEEKHMFFSPVCLTERKPTRDFPSSKTKEVLYMCFQNDSKTKVWDIKRKYENQK